MDTRNYLVVGGTSGTGGRLVSDLLDAGQAVWSASRSAASAASRDRLTPVTLDVTEESFPENVLPDELAGLAYCPGTITLRPLARLSIDDFRKDLEVNLLGAVRAIQWALPALRNGPQASAIVLFSTVAVQTGMPYHASIAAAKGAVEGLARSLAAELAPRVRVNAVALSLIDTPLAGRLLATEEKRKLAASRHPLGRVGTACEAARLARFLLTPDSAWMTGQVVHLDGGIGELRQLQGGS